MTHKKYNLISAFLLVFFVLLIPGCNSTKIVFPEINTFEEANPLAHTGHIRLGASGSYIANLYPECDLSQIKELPVYKYNEEYDTLYERIIEFSEKISVDVSEMTEEYREKNDILIYDGEKSDDGTTQSVWASDCFVAMSVSADMGDCANMLDTPIGSFPSSVEYDTTDEGLVISEEIIQLYKDNGAELLKKLRKEDYVLCSVTVKPYEDHLTLEDDEYNICTTLLYRPQRDEDESDVLLDYYSLNSYIRLSVSYFFTSVAVSLSERNADWMTEVGEFNIIPYSDAQARFDKDDNVKYGDYYFLYEPYSDVTDETLIDSINAESVKDYDTYLVYVEDYKGYIRPIYMKQNWDSVGQMYGSAWFDAINY